MRNSIAALLCLPLLCGSCLAWQSGANPAGNTFKCDLNGDVFGLDPIEQNLLVKDDKGELSFISYIGRTRFLRVAEGGTGEDWTPGRVQVGDRVCVQYTSTTSRDAATISVLPRNQLQRQEKKEIRLWLATTLFGVVREIDIPSGNLLLGVNIPAGLQAVSLAVDQNTRWRRIASDGGLIATKPITPDSLQPGDTVFVTGKPSSGRGFHTELVLAGDLRSLAGTINKVDVLNEQITLQDLESGKTMQVHIGPAALFRNVTLGTDQRLSDLSFADLREGDGVFVLGRPKEDEFQGLALLAGFSSFDILPKQQEQRVHWALFTLLHALP